MKRNCRCPRGWTSLCVLLPALLLAAACTAPPPPLVPPSPTLSADVPAIPVQTAAPLPSPATSSTPTPAPSATPTPTPTLPPTPDMPSILAALQPVVSGLGVPDAAAYDPDRPEPHPLVLLTTAGAAYTESVEDTFLPGSPSYKTVDWNGYLPDGWVPSSLADTELVVLIGPEREISLGSQAYSPGLGITAYQYETDMEIREARTGLTVKRYTFRGSDPRPFPQRAPLDQTRLEGTHLVYPVLEEWLCPSATPQGCWQRLLTADEPDFLIQNTAFSPDGTWLAAWNGNVDSVELRRASDGAVVHTLTGHTSGVTGVAFSPDGALLATGSFDKTVRLWRVADGARLSTLEGPADWVDRVGFSPDGKTVIAEVSDHTACVWRVTDGALLLTLLGQENVLADAAFSPDGQILAAVAGEKDVQLWSAADGTLLETLAGHTHWVKSLSFSPDGQTLASASGDGTVRLWQVSGGALERVLEAQGSWVDSVAFSSDGRALAAVLSTSRALLWRASDWTLLRALDEPFWAFSPDGQMLATGLYDGARLWSASDGTLLRGLEKRADWTRGVLFSPDGQTLALTTSEGTVQLWETSTGALLRTLWLNSGAEDLRVSFGGDGQTLTVQTVGLTYLWRLGR